MNEDRIRYNVEVYRIDNKFDSLQEVEQVESISEVSEVIEELEEEDKLDWPNEVRISKVANLEGSLTDEEEKELQQWIDELGGEASDGTELSA